MLELRPDSPIDPVLHEILQHAKEATSALGIDFFVGGAMARDILLVHVHGQRVNRATRDVDIGLFIQDWASFDTLKSLFVASGKFFEVPGRPYRLSFSVASGAPLDLIPFGTIAGVGQLIAWPPDHEVVLNVAGFDDALRSATPVHLGQGLQVAICNLAALSVLKLIAWRDRGQQNSKDAADFFTLARHYDVAGNMDRIYAEEGQAFLEVAAYDTALAGASLLGRDAATLSQRSTVSLVEAILISEELLQRLVDHLIREQLGVGIPDDGRITATIDAYRRGFLQQR